MRQFFAHLFYGVLDRLLDATVIAATYQDEPVPNNELQVLKRCLDDVRRNCTDIGLKYSALRTKEVHIELQQPQLIGTALVALLDDIKHRIRHELSTDRFFVIPEDRVKYLQPSLFGEKVSDAFPSITYDVERAGSCMAFDQYTACVFHLMRSIEAGLNVVGKALGVKTDVPSWNGVLINIDKAIKQKSLNRRWKTRHEEFYSAAHASLYAIKNAWRNPAMHVRGKYDDKEAEHIFGLVRGFMQHLAKRLKEGRAGR